MKKEFALLITLATIQFSQITDFMILMPLGPELMRSFSILPNQFALLVSSYTLSAGVSGFVGAFYIDRFNRKTALLYSCFGFALGTLLCGFSNSYYLLLLTRSITGIFGGVLSSLLLSIVGDTIPNERRAFAMGILMGAFSVASVLGVPLGLALANISNWKFPFLCLGGVAMLTLIPIWYTIPNMTDHILSSNSRPKALKIIGNVARNKNQMLALLFSSTVMFSHFSIIPFISPYMVSNVGFTEQQIIYIYFIGGILTIFSSPLIGWLSDKFGRSKVYATNVIIASIPIFLMTNIGQNPIYLVLCITSMFFVFGAGRFVPSNAMITSSVKPENRGSFMSFNIACRSITNGIAAYLGGIIITQGPDGLFYNYNLVGYFAITMGIVSIFIGRKLRVVDDESFKN